MFSLRVWYHARVLVATPPVIRSLIRATSHQFANDKAKGDTKGEGINAFGGRGTPPRLASRRCN
jgi:hypothetical protein